MLIKCILIRKCLADYVQWIKHENLFISLRWILCNVCESLWSLM